MKSTGTVLGIDVGCSPTRRSSAICALSWTETTLSWTMARFRAIEPERERVIAEVGGELPITVAAFDGPLRRGFDVIGRYRMAERLLSRRLPALIGKPGQSNAPVGQLLNHHANECARHVAARCNVEDATHAVAIDDKALVEAFPNTFLGMLIADPGRLTVRRGNRSDLYYEHLVRAGALQRLIKHCLPGRRLTASLEQVRNHDDRAALVCALTALVVASGDFVAVGDHEDGWIILPPRRFIAPAQWELLELNATEQLAGALHRAEN